jgi:hypothetical protein
VTLERVRIISRFEDLPLAQIRRGIVYILAAWSDPSVMHFRLITEAFSRIDWSRLEFYLVDIDCVPDDFYAGDVSARCARWRDSLGTRRRCCHIGPHVCSRRGRGGVHETHERVAA